MKNSIDRWKAEARGSARSPMNLTNFDSVILVRNFLQRLSGPDRRHESCCREPATRASAVVNVPAAATKITPGLRSRPFNEGCMNERYGLTDLHISTVRFN